MSSLYLLPVAIPALYLGMALLMLRSPARWPLWLVWLPVLAAAGTGWLALTVGAGHSPVLGLAGVGVSVRVDALSAILLLLVSFLGTSVLHYSRQYLAGDSRHGQFMAELALTLAAVTTLVAAGNLYLLVGAWVAMSLLLNRLLLFRRERRMARVAATKKFILARFGDLSLIVACGLLIAEFGTAEIGALADTIRTLPGELPGAAKAAAALLALTAVLKSAQFPTHGWLVEVMETPTPVSALLHAGIVNAGGFLFLRFSDLMLAAPSIGLTVATIGAITAAVGTAIMLTQPSIKSALAYSTVGQMGFMMMQCGLGAYTAAVLHLVGHSLYKAHAFLSSGDVVRRLRVEAWTQGARAGGMAQGLLLLAALAAVYLGVASLAGFGWQAQPVVFSLGWMLVLGLWLFLDAPLQSPGRYLRMLAGAAAVTGAYFALQNLASIALADVLVTGSDPGLFGRGLLLAVVLGFSTIALMQSAGLAQARFSALRVHLARGLYINLFINRWLGANRAESPRQGV